MTLNQNEAPAIADRSLDDVVTVMGEVRQAIETIIEGKRDTIDLALVVLLAEGHLLLEDVPGVGKTMLAKALGRSIDCSVRRVQFTPDLLPSDITGVSVFNQENRTFEFKPGGIFANIVVGDEINRASPKTQSALLEAMEERQVSVDGTTYLLEAPFMVVATQNPIEMEGTYPLPEAQLDRFAIRLELGYLDQPDEVAMLRRRLDRGSAPAAVRQIVGADDLLAMQESVEQVSVHDDVLAYVVSLATASRQHPQVAVGASPRAELDLVQLARAHALLAGRDYVIPEDVKALAVPALAHRISLRPEMWVRRVQGADVIHELLRRLPVPRTGGTP